MKTYTETLSFIFAQLPMYQRIGDAAMKKNLDNIIALCEALGNPHKSFKSIHIAGTNGKGSITHILSNVLSKANYKVGCYTSPHYKDFRERIKIIQKKEAVKLIPESEVVNFIAQITPLIERIKPSFFEMTVAMAFYFFEKEKIDVAIIETGLGGRLDSTNIIKPELSIISNISKDHTQFLGETLAEIAGEKAGIIKAKTAVIIGKKQGETKSVFKEKAKQMQSKLYFAENELQLLHFKTKFGKKTTFEIQKEQKKHLFKTDLIGDYQKENITTALCALFYLKKQHIFKIKWKHLKKGMIAIKKDTYFLGRNNVLAKHPLTIADSAHNVAGIAELTKQISKINYFQLHFVYGTVSDKDVDTIFTLLPKDAIYYFCKPNIPRGMETENLIEKSKKYQLKANAFQSVDDALNEAKKQASFNDLIVVSGSIFVVAEII